MSYKYEGLAQTQSGKIIYRRKKHEFTWKDLKRMLLILRTPGSIQAYLIMLLVGIILMQQLRNTRDRDVNKAATELEAHLRRHGAEEERFTGFGGGQFGGGGSTGTFWRPLVP